MPSTCCALAPVLATRYAFSPTWRTGSSPAYSISSRPDPAFIAPDETCAARAALRCCVEALSPAQRLNVTPPFALLLVTRCRQRVACNDGQAQGLVQSYRWLMGWVFPSPLGVIMRRNA